MNNVSVKPTYSVQFINNSTNPGSVCIYQTSPNQASTNIMSVAWMTQFLSPRMQTTFDWQTNYSFFSAQVGQIRPGVIVNVNQSVAADPVYLNEISFDFIGGNSRFSGPTQGVQQGAMVISEGSGIPFDILAVGIGMNDSPIFVAQAMPNNSVSFDPNTEFWIVFGNFADGQILNIQNINNTAQVIFPPGVYSVQAVLNVNNSWTLTAV